MGFFDLWKIQKYFSLNIGKKTCLNPCGQLFNRFFSMVSYSTPSICLQNKLQKYTRSKRLDPTWANFTGFTDSHAFPFQPAFLVPILNPLTRNSIQLKTHFIFLKRLVSDPLHYYWVFQMQSYFLPTFLLMKLLIFALVSY